MLVTLHAMILNRQLAIVVWYIDYVTISVILHRLMHHQLYLIMRKFGNDNVCLKWMDEDFGKNVWRMNRLAKRLLIVTTNLDGFSLANSR